MHTQLPIITQKKKGTCILRRNNIVCLRQIDGTMRKKKNACVCVRSHSFLSLNTFFSNCEGKKQGMGSRSEERYKKMWHRVFFLFSTCD